MCWWAEYNFSLYGCRADMKGTRYCCFLNQFIKYVKWMQKFLDFMVKITHVFHICVTHIVMIYELLNDLHFYAWCLCWSCNFAFTKGQYFFKLSKWECIICDLPIYVELIRSHWAVMLQFQAPNKICPRNTGLPSQKRIIV